MRGVQLVIRARRVPTVTAILLGTGVLSFVVGGLVTGGVTSNYRAFAVVALWSPTVAAGVAVTCIHSMMLELEQTAVRSQRLIVLSLIFVVVAVSSVSLLPSATFGADGYGAAAVMRNLAGAFGVALLAAPVGGSRLAWGGPILYAVAVNSVGAGSGSVPPLWAWSLRQQSDGAAGAVATMLLFAGLVATVVFHRPAQRTPDLGGG